MADKGLTLEKMLANGFEAVGRMNFQAARDWYEQAAEGGSAIGAMSLAEMYETGMGGAANRQKALEFYRKAARTGSDPARDKLHKMYREDVRSAAKEATGAAMIIVLYELTGDYLPSFEWLLVLVAILASLALVVSMGMLLWRAFLLTRFDRLYPQSDRALGPVVRGLRTFGRAMRKIVRVGQLFSLAVMTFMWLFAAGFAVVLLTGRADLGARSLASDLAESQLARLLASWGWQIPMLQLVQTVCLAIIAVVIGGFFSAGTDERLVAERRVLIGTAALIAALWLGLSAVIFAKHHGALEPDIIMGFELGGTALAALLALVTARLPWRRFAQKSRGWVGR